MISNVYDENISVDLCRPDLTCDADWNKWGEFNKWIEESETPVTVSSAYGFVKHMCETRQGYLGGNMHYCFWFENVTYKEQFLDKYKEIFG